MNGLLLPCGPRTPVRGDSHGVSATSPPLAAKQESDQHAPIKHDDHSRFNPDRPLKGDDSIAGEPRRASASLRSNSGFSHGTGPGVGPNLTAAASLAFIPRSSRSSTGLRKPIHQCSEFDLEQMLDRNERILTALQHTHTPTKERLLEETETIRAAIRSIRAVRDVGSGILGVKLEEPTAEAELETALLGLNVKEEASLAGTSPPADSFGWSRDTVAVKKKLAQDSATFSPGRKVQSISYEHSLAIQTAALVAEMERERKGEEQRSKAGNSSRDKAGRGGVPSGAAHRLGRKSISSCSGSMRRFSGAHSTSPPKVSRAAGPLARATASSADARNLDHGLDRDAELEGGDSDQDDAAAAYEDEENREDQEVYDYGEGPYQYDADADALAFHGNDL
ncbi:hypothetical protein BCV70DRAFT_27768 [Testicularia cyperi]|uniref:Uncharacterized protein n=1 Tax=Testicularia cyperi TaxID=1882483 RepID=A0A317XNA6_9BASI|nr:hypothetical protein BCV70DRAFT_27768 [Testicularia cyperi]